MDHVAAVVFDWAGTMVDFGSRAPMGVFVEAMHRFGVEITIAEARRPMGLPKRDHIAALLADPRIAAAWQAQHGAPPDEASIDAVYAVFVPLNEAVAADYADLVPGALPVVQALEARGVKIGSTTGYTRSILTPVMERAAALGYRPQSVVCADDLAAGRPSPLAMYQTFATLGVWPAWRVVKVDDTVPGIAEGRAAGCWTIGVAASGNGVGLSWTEWQALSAAEQRRLADAAAEPLRSAGADFVIDTVADLLPALDQVNQRLAAGERPLPPV
ncbi:MAG: phosphonoacetaldehyde hydrolase [Alphaproteobacteria bacterium]|nr:phosphonoacetaldehyde hydrolase [Alphaproteobacteria bacterium]TAD89463.1 MAG: phosphonoacetaldehyde hydrolase [Alphaproteobacteria bacterium]